MLLLLVVPACCGAGLPRGRPHPRRCPPKAAATWEAPGRKCVQPSSSGCRGGRRQLQLFHHDCTAAAWVVLQHSAARCSEQGQRCDLGAWGWSHVRGLQLLYFVSDFAQIDPHHIAPNADQTAWAPVLHCGRWRPLVCAPLACIWGQFATPPNACHAPAHELLETPHP